MLDFCKNIFRAFKTSFKLFFSPKVTLNYPEEIESHSDNVRHSHVIDTKKCVACGTCAKACPSKAINVSAHCNGDTKELDEISIDYGKCCFCGICDSACHKKAIKLTSENIQTVRKKTVVKNIKNISRIKK